MGSKSMGRKSQAFGMGSKSIAASKSMRMTRASLAGGGGFGLDSDESDGGNLSRKRNIGGRSTQVSPMGRSTTMSPNMGGSPSKALGRQSKALSPMGGGRADGTGSKSMRASKNMETASKIWIE